ncbi:MAG: ferrous iron transport protein B [Methanosarcinaceae archaeon]|nr:ferrous iron transport protein B [Methanosarcinaceae archaeon]MDD4330897.1 ferrous iron transport protein B [Methanosarcinaceae archaeon]MDD4749754.1 ferrous iron transport protein B [Methanosarcinaceae archaeon]
MPDIFKSKNSGKKLRVALTGNPNVGKTSLFNALTGSRQHVGNWPGVTVEKKTGTLKHEGFEIEVIDLPGTYSLTAYSPDEIVARDYIIEEKPDVVIQVLDATNLERNLYLTTQLLELGAQVLIALNMTDLAEERGDSIDIQKMEEFLEVPVVKTVAREEKGIPALLDAVLRTAGKEHVHKIGYGNALESKIGEIMTLLSEDTGLKAAYPLRWLSVKLLEGDENAFGKIKGRPVESKVRKLLDSEDMAFFEAEMADQRYETISCLTALISKKPERVLEPSDLIDRVLTSKKLGIPIFLALMWGAFDVTFTFGTPFMNIIDSFFGWLSGVVSTNVSNPWLSSFLGDGIIGGVGSVILFLPNILLLFLMLSILEDSGYLARAAFVMDRLMYSIGLQGKASIPMLMGFGCTVPAIMATRTLESPRDRLLTILVTPFMSCGARMPVYVVLAGTFFGESAGSVIFAIYILGIMVAIFSAKLLGSTVLKGEVSPFIMELPPYRLPSPKTSLLHMWENGSMYLKKAGTIILAGVVLVWLAASLPVGVEYGSESSLIGSLGHFLEPLVAPLGFDWKVAVALVFGFVAKEVVIGSLGVLYGAGEDESAIMAGMQADPALDPVIAFGLMVFTLLYVPCVATVGVIKKETGSWKWTLFSAAYGTTLAWIFAFLIYQGSRILGWT